MLFSKDAFAARLRGRMAELGMTRAEVAKASGLSEDAVTKYARGVYVPGADKVAALAKALECDPNTLMCWYD